MRTGIFGGSFNPPHFGHLFLLLYVLERWELDRIFVTPCYRHAFLKELIPFEHRLEMMKIALLPFGGRVLVSDMERGLEGANYTIETLKRFREAFPQDRFSIIVGSDILKELPLWKDYGVLEREAEFIVVGRGGYTMEGGAIYLPEISSSLIRERMREGENISHLVPARVVDYIEKHGLYRGE